MLRRTMLTLLFLVSALALVAFVYVAARVVGRPHAIDPVEVAVLEGAERLVHGDPLYVAPATADVPSLMPGYPFAVSLLVRAFGPGLWEPRALALVATLLIALMVLAIIRMETESWTLATAGVGFLLLGYGLLAEPPGVARPETLMLLLVLLGFFVLRMTNGVVGVLLSALVFAAAFFTDLTAVWFVAAALFALVIDEHRRLITFTLVIGVLIGGGYVALSEALGPWFNFNAWDHPFAALRFSVLRPLHYVGDHLLGKLGVLSLAAVLSFAMPTQPWRGKGGLWMCMGVAALVGGLLSTQSSAFGPQSLIASVVVLALVGPISMQRVTRHLAAWPGSSRLGGQGVVLAALTLQFIVFLACLSPSRWLSGMVSAQPNPPSISEPRAPQLPRS